MIKKTPNNTISCPVCDSKNLSVIYQKNRMPIYNLEKHYNRRDAINAKAGAVKFCLCHNCIFVFNSSFDPSLINYSIEYESSRSYSKYFRNYLNKVCTDLNNVFEVNGKTIVEVGCGDGAFLQTLQKKYKFSGYGFDPSINQNKINGDNQNITFINDYYNSYLNYAPDIVVIRHVIEHVHNPKKFFESVLPKTSIYIEVPAWEWIIDNNQINVFSYEHCSYYSKYSIEYALSLYNFSAKKISFTFKNEYLQFFGVHTRMNVGMKTRPCKELLKKSYAFQRKILVLSIKLKKALKNIMGNSVLWGAAGKGTTLLNMLDISYKQIEYVIDSNPARSNTYIPLTGQQVVNPDFLKSLKPKYILITNFNYYPEIKSKIEKLNLSSRIVPLDKLLLEL